MFHISFLLVYFIVNSFDRKKKTKIDFPKKNDFSRFNLTIFEFSFELDLFDFRMLRSTFFGKNWLPLGEVHFFLQESTSTGWSQFFPAKVDFNRLKSIFFATLFLAPKLQTGFFYPFCLQPAAVAKTPLQPHTTPTHVNRQTDKECAWGRPRLLKLLFFLDLSWHVTKGLLRDYFT